MGTQLGSGSSLLITPDVVNLVVINEWRKTVLLIKRGKGKTGEGLLAFPGGKIDPGETALTALSREMYEEMGLSFMPQQFKFICDQVSSNGKKPRFFELIEPNWNLIDSSIRIDPREIESWVLLKKDEALEHMAFACHRRTLEALNL